MQCGGTTAPANRNDGLYVDALPRPTRYGRTSAGGRVEDSPARRPSAAGMQAPRRVCRGSCRSVAVAVEPVLRGDLRICSPSLPSGLWGRPGDASPLVVFVAWPKEVTKVSLFREVRLFPLVVHVRDPALSAGQLITRGGDSGREPVPWSSMSLVP